METTPGGVSELSWSRYWAAGHEHSCPTSFTGFYGPELRAFWRRQCQGLTAQDLVLDLGCGNGGLLRFLHSQFQPGESPRLCGVDAARLRTGGFGAGAPVITVYERTSFHALPFPPASVSVALSQFGIEYDNTDEGWAELLRVLRPVARVAFVLHKRDSLLDRVAADEIVIGRAAFASGLFGHALAMVPYLQRATTEAGRAALSQDRTAEAARADFNTACAAVEGFQGLLRHAGYAGEILQGVTGVLSEVASGGGFAAGDRLESLRLGVEDHLTRIAALRASALDGEGLQRVRTRLLTAGFALAEAATISESGNEMGWTIEGQR